MLDTLGSGMHSLGRRPWTCSCAVSTRETRMFICCCCCWDGPLPGRELVTTSAGVGVLLAFSLRLVVVSSTSRHDDPLPRSALGQPSACAPAHDSACVQNCPSPNVPEGTSAHHLHPCHVANTAASSSQTWTYDRQQFRHTRTPNGMLVALDHRTTSRIYWTASRPILRKPPRHT